MVIDFVINIILVIGLVSLFNLTRYIFKIRKLIKKYKDNPNIEGITIINGEVRVIEKQQLKEGQLVQEQKVENVIDPVCYKEVEKKSAYRVIKAGKEYFFCSWECREKFLAQKEGI